MPPLTEETSLTRFKSGACATKFRQALRQVASKAYTERGDGKLIMFVRPHSILHFGHALIKIGLQNCEASNARLRFLDRHQNEFIRFEHEVSQ